MAEDVRTVGWHYEAARGRIDALVRPLPPERWEASVPACPGWRVRDVLAHLIGSPEDAAAGRLQGAPTEEQTAEQVARHGDETVPELLDTWAEVAPFVAETVTAMEMWPAAIDAVTHEHDLRAALGQPGARDHESVEVLARLVAAPLASTPVPVSVELDDGVAGAPDADLRLRTSAFDLLRLRMGRRSRRQVLALDWSGDPTGALPHLFVFGPSEHDQVE